VNRWILIGVAALAVLGAGYTVMHRGLFGLAGARPIGADDSRDREPTTTPKARPATIEWQKVDRSSDGFRVEMPTDVKHIQIPAYTETGGTEQMDMIFSNPDAETTFSVTWEDNPAVARASNGAPDRTLEMARDGAVARTQTTLVNEAADNLQGFPGRVFEARNSGGGVMNSRLIYVGSRLYMLVAAFPSIKARRDKDVERFFNSFAVTSAAGNGKARSADSAKKD
jgi:hypothetical protein